MEKIHKKLMVIILISLFVIFIVSTVSAFKLKELKTKNFLGKWTSSVSDKFQKLAGFKDPKEGDKIFGMQIPTSSSFMDSFRHFLIGLMAGLWIWLATIIQAHLRYIKEKSLGQKYKINPLSGIKIRWLSLVGGRIWKIFVIAFSYAIITQIPLINWIVKIIFLDFLQGFFKKTFILALIIGFLPSIVEYYMKIKLETKYQKMVAHAEKIGLQVDKEKEE